MSEIAISFQGHVYGAAFNFESIAVSAKMRVNRHTLITHDEEKARRWLCDHGLKKSKAKKLLAAALRGEGELADASHPKRVVA